MSQEGAEGRRGIVEGTGSIVSVRRRRSSFAIGVAIEMVENLAHDAGLGDESDDAEGASTRTEEWVELENSSNQIGPAAPQRLLSSRAQGRLVLLWLVIGVRSLLGGLRNLASSPNDVGVVAVVKEQMSPGLRDLRDDACQELESVDFFERGEKLSWIVVRGFGSVENVRRAWAPLHSG